MMSLLYVLAIAVHLKPFAVVQQRLDHGSVDPEESGRGTLQRLELIRVDIVPWAFGKPVQKHGPIASTICDNRSKPARPPLSSARHALFDQVAAEVGVNQAAFGARDGLAQGMIYIT
jgi:hypothetical protein